MTLPAIQRPEAFIELIPIFTLFAHVEVVQMLVEN